MSEAGDQMTDRTDGRPAAGAIPAELTVRCVLLLVLGVVVLGLRVASVFLPRPSLTVLVHLFGWFALADGVASLVIGLWRIRRAAPAPVQFLRGALGVGVGAFVVAADVAAGPVGGVMGRLVRLFQLWAVASGALDLAVASGALRGEGGRLLGFAGGASVLVAVLLAIWPPARIPFLVLWVAGYAFLVGLLLLVRVIRLV
jgi:uncharacterized membrane protein HdeD (DUF308 family)